jgi:transketolase C-terminal domain/subunit
LLYQPGVERALLLAPAARLASGGLNTTVSTLSAICGRRCWDLLAGTILYSSLVLSRMDGTDGSRPVATTLSTFHYLPSTEQGVTLRGCPFLLVRMTSGFCLLTARG